MPSLHSPIQFGAVSAPNRIFMAPLTRCRADADHVPTDVMAEYYAQRASGGLLIAEATMVMEGNSSFWMEPGIYSAAQVAGWKKSLMPCMPKADGYFCRYGTAAK